MLYKQGGNAMTNITINLTSFRKEFDISADFAKSICKVMGIEIKKVNDKPTIPLYNHALQIENDLILLFASNESNITGKIENTKSKNFDDEVIDKLSKQVADKRNGYIIMNEEAETSIIKPPDDAIDIEAITDLELRRKDFITMMTQVITEAVSKQNRPILETQQSLHNAMEKGWLLTNDQLASLLGMSKSTISSKPDGWKRMGFQYTKMKEGSMTLWKVSQY